MGRMLVNIFGSSEALVALVSMAKIDLDWSSESARTQVGMSGSLEALIAWLAVYE